MLSTTSIHKTAPFDFDSSFVKQYFGQEKATKLHYLEFVQLLQVRERGGEGGGGGKEGRRGREEERGGE